MQSSHWFAVSVNYHYRNMSIPKLAGCSLFIWTALLVQADFLHSSQLQLGFQTPNWILNTKLSGTKLLELGERGNLIEVAYL